MSILCVTVSHRSHKSACGQVLTLGEGDTGQLGLGPDVMERTKPGKVDLPPDVTQVCAGGMHTVCRTSSGEVSQTRSVVLESQVQHLQRYIYEQKIKQSINDNLTI